MSDAPTIAAHRSAGIGPGRLVVVVGPSGAGKDTLLNLARAACVGDSDVVFPRRIVTREGSASEDNLQLDHAAFGTFLEQATFAVSWDAHGHRYALPGSIDDDIRAGRTVVANVSRTVVGRLRQRYADVTVVAVTAPPEVLAQRLAMRARGSDGAIEERLGRSVDETDRPDVTIVNVGDAAQHADRLLRAIKGKPSFE